MNITLEYAGLLTFTGASSVDGFKENGELNVTHRTYKRHIIDIKANGVWVGCYEAKECSPTFWIPNMQVEATWQRFHEISGTSDDVRNYVPSVFAKDTVAEKAVRSYVRRERMAGVLRKIGIGRLPYIDVEFKARYFNVGMQSLESFSQIGGIRRWGRHG